MASGRAILEAMDSAGFSPRPSRLRRYAVLGGLAVFFFAADVMLPAQLFVRVGDYIDEIAAAVNFGIVASQTCLIAVWAAMGPARELLRFPWVILLGIGTWYAILLGVHIQVFWHEDPTIYYFWDRSSALILGIIILGSVMALLFPFALAKRAFRWRLVCTDTGHRSDIRQFGIRHLLAGTIALAILIVVGQRLMPPEGTYTVASDAIGWLFFLVLLAFATILVALPALYAASLARRFPRSLILLAWAGYALILAFLEIQTISVALSSPPSRNEYARVLFVFFLWQYTFAVAFIGSLWLLELAGFRLVKAVPRRKE